MTEHEKLEKIIEDLKRAQRLVWDTKEQHCNIMDDDDALTVRYAIYDALELLKKHEPVEPHYTKLEYMVNGMPYVVHHPECPRCIENGLILWDAEIERGAAYCKRCGQAVKWNDK